MWKKILVVQICVCLFIISGYFSINNSASDEMKAKQAEIIASLSRHNTVADIWNEGKCMVMSIIKAPVVLTNYVISANDTKEYAEPVDLTSEGDITSVYAVLGGQVTETGENNQIGKYIKIQHENSISIYGECSRIYVREGRHVRRGQVIGSYMKDKNNPFYYDLIEE